MKKMLVFLLMAGLFLTQAAVYAQSDQGAAKAPPVSQPLVREGDLAAKLVEVLKIGKANNEAEAETMLGTAGVAPKNGWIADYPVTPDIIGELQKAVREAADAKKLPMGKEEALKAFRTATVEAGIPIVAELPGRYPETQSQCTEPSAVDNYYSTEGPPVVSYCPPPPDYGYLYAWVPFPFFFDVFFFPGFFILHDFHKIIIVNRTVVVVTNHFIDPKTRAVALIDPVKRGTGKGFITTSNRPRMGFASTEARKSAASIFERSRERTKTTIAPMDRGRGATSSNTLSQRSEGASNAPSTRGGNSFSGRSTGERGSFRTFHGGGFSGHGGSGGRCGGRC